MAEQENTTQKTPEYSPQQLEAAATEVNDFYKMEVLSRMIRGRGDFPRRRPFSHKGRLHNYTIPVHRRPLQPSIARDIDKDWFDATASYPPVLQERMMQIRDFVRTATMERDGAPPILPLFMEDCFRPRSARNHIEPEEQLVTMLLVDLLMISRRGGGAVIVEQDARRLLSCIADAVRPTNKRMGLAVERGFLGEITSRNIFSLLLDRNLTLPAGRALLKI